MTVEDIDLGRPGNTETRKARIEAHKVFDKVVAEGRIPDRTSAYRWMQKKMRLSPRQAHIGQFTKNQCEKLIRLVQQEFPDLKTSWDRLLDDPLGDY